MSTATLVGSDLSIDGTRANDVIEVLANLEPTHNLQDGAIELEVAAKGTVGSTDSRRFEAADIFVGPMKSMPIDDPAGAAVAGKVILPAPYATVVANGQEIGRFDLSTFESVKIYGHDGDDRLSVTDALHTLIYLDGGNGNDTLFIEPDKTPSEDPSKWFRPPTTTSVMLGGDGDDLLVGSNGVDMLIGGFGNDVALGYGGDDLLIGGATLADGNTKTLFSLLSTWNSEDDYMDRVDNFRTAVGELIPYDTDATFVSYDDSTDVLEGGEGQDWFFTGDRAELPDLSKDEIVDW